MEKWKQLLHPPGRGLGAGVPLVKRLSASLVGLLTQAGMQGRGEANSELKVSPAWNEKLR